MLKEVAATHEVLYVVPKIDLNWKFIDRFQYDSTIRDNFKNLQRDLESLNLKRVRIKTKVYCIGEWSQWLAGHRKVYKEDDARYAEAPNWGFKDFGNWEYFGKLSQEFDGTPEEVVVEFKKFLQNPYWGFYVGGCPDPNDKDKLKWDWARPQGCIRFKIEAFSPEKVELVKPDIKIVEVIVEEPDEKLKRRAEAEVEAYLSQVENKRQLEKMLC